MNETNNYKTEKLGHDEKKKKADLERRTGVPDPPVPNRAHTEMSARSRAEGVTHAQAHTSSLNIDESALHDYADRYKHKRMHDAKINADKE